MKKVLLLISFVLFAVVSAFSQTATLSYQAVVRDSHNKLVPDTDIPVEVSVSVGGTEKYYETRTVRTNRNGVVSFSIGGDGRTWPVAGHPTEDLSSVTGWSTATIAVTFHLSGGDVTTSSPVTAVPYALEVGNVNLNEYLKIEGLCDSIEHSCTNVPLKNADNEFTGSNIVPKGFDISSTTSANCNNIVVNACDLFAVFDSLTRRIDDILRTIDTLRNVNDSLADLLQEVMPHLTITGPSSVGYCGGSNIVTFSVTMENANAENYTYSWSVNGSAQSSTASTMSFTPDATGTYKVVCIATRSGHTTLKDSTALSVTDGGQMPVLGICCEGRTVTVKITQGLLTSTVAWGDGTESVVTDGDTHEYTSEGTYTIIASSTAYGNCKLLWPVTITETSPNPCTVTTPHTNSSDYTVTTGGLETVENGKVVSVQDQDGHSYYVVQIGNQCWMRSNLRTSKYNDGTAITGGENYSPYSKTEPYYYINPSYDASKTGYFYNWPAAAHKNSSDQLDLCPKGWHVPSQTEWATLLSAAGVTTPKNSGTGAVYLAGGCDWEEATSGVSSQTPNSYENPDRDKWGFTAVPAGHSISTTYVDAGWATIFWTSTEVDADQAKSVYLGNYPGADNNALDKENGRIVRCLRDGDGGSTVIDAPTVNTTAATDVSTTSATLNGTVEANGNTITAQGFEWKVTEGGSYTQVSASGATMTYSLTGLTAGTGYTYRAFATTSEGTEYGSEVTFTTTSGSVTPPTPTDCGTVTDASGNTYNTVVIGSQCWMKENLRTTKYNDGTDIVTYYDYSSSIIPLERRGYLYDWDVVMNQSGDHDICPSGWHVPSMDEWESLNVSEYQCNGDIARALAANTDWYVSTSTCAECDVCYDLSNNNSSGFSAIPAGFYDDPNFDEAESSANFWTSSYNSSYNEPKYVIIDIWNGYSLYSNPASNGYSVRCVRD